MPGVFGKKMDGPHQITNDLLLRSQKTKHFFVKKYKSTFLSMTCKALSTLFNSTLEDANVLAA